MSVKSTVICSNCGEENDSDARYCVNCGNEMPQKVYIVDSNGNVQEERQPAPSSAAGAQSSAPRTQQPGSSAMEEQTQTLSEDEMRAVLQKLQNTNLRIEDYFPSDLPKKQGKLDSWKKQIVRAQACLDLQKEQLFRELSQQQTADYQRALAEAISILDFTREYTVKLIGPAGAGKSTLLTALLGRDILPTGFGTAVTGVRTRIRLCSPNELEVLHIRFLTRAAFDQLLSETEAMKNEELARKAQQGQSNGKSQADEEGPYAKEWRRLTFLRDNGPDKNKKDTYVDIYLNQAQPLTISQDKWKTESRKYLTEPKSVNNESEPPYLVRLVDTAQFDLHTNRYSLLPEGSIMVDLPGSSAGKVYHDRILQDELGHLDAVILVANGPRYDNDGTRKIFDQVLEAVWNGSRSSDIAARMVFIAATRWDEIKTDDDLKSARSGMDGLIKKLPPNYQKYHRHGPQGNYAFYPISAFDARMAMLGLEDVVLDPEQAEEARTYKGDITAVYDKLRAIDSSLPPTFSPNDFKSSPHQAMLTYSGLPELTQDLRHFLTEQRYEVQLQDATERLNQAFQRIEEACWSYLQQQDFLDHDLQKLKRENQTRQSDLRNKRSGIIGRSIEQMEIAWQQAVKDYDRASMKESTQNSFYRALKDAYDQSVEHVQHRIDDNEFDEFFKVKGRDSQFSWAISPKEEFTDFDGNGLRSALRSRLWSILEQRINQPAQVLADMFLATIEKQGPGTDGALDIERISFNEENEELDEIKRIYAEIISDIRVKARDICQYVTLSELIDENKHVLTKDHQYMKDLYALGDITVTLAANQAGSPSEAKTPDDILAIAHNITKKMVVALSDGLVESTYQRIAFIYHSELDKLEKRTVYDLQNPDQPLRTKSGAFKNMKDRLSSHMSWLLQDSPTLALKIDRTTLEEIDFSAWADFIEEMRKRKKGA